MTNARRIRALVVDDEPLARDMIREMLEDDSEVEIVGECANGREAVEAIKSLNAGSRLSGYSDAGAGWLRSARVVRASDSLRT